jgi:hypothetical protein
MDKNISFLFGAGFSIPFTNITTKKITDLILKGDKVLRHTNGQYYIKEDNNFSHHGIYKREKYVKKILILINRIKEYIDEFYEREINYEDIYYVISQLYEDMSKNYDNPILYPFTEEISLNDIGEMNAGELLKESLAYIEGVVKDTLSQDINNNDIKDLGFLRKIIFDYKADIYTLNHDKILEKWLEHNSINYTDGFNKRNNDIAKWESDLFNKKQDSRLFKLHGSIDWSRFSKLNSEKNIIGISQGNFIENAKKGYIWENNLILLGNHNKILEYTHSIFSTLFCYFWSSLNETDILIVSGYSFGDKGINSRLIHWLNEIGEKMIIIHPNIINLKKSARGAISNNWDKWVSENKLHTMEKRIEEVIEKDVYQYL